MRNILVKNCREYRITYFRFHNFFFRK